MEQWRASLRELAELINDWISGHLELQMPLHLIDMQPEPGEPLLEIEVSDRKIIRLEPTDHGVGQVPTTVNLYAYPTLRRVQLFGPVNGSWVIQSSDGVPMNYPWTQESILQLLNILAEQSVAS